MNDPAYALSLKESHEGQIPRGLERQSRALDELHTSLSELEERLAPVRSIQPSPSADPAPESIRAGLSQIIADRADSIDYATRRVRQITAELEL
jgi:hypothetical protein